MTPQAAYDDGVCQVWQADARELPLVDQSVQLIITSPPYNARVAYDGYADWLPWEDYWHGLIEPALRECYRVLVPGGRIAVNIANVLRQDIGNVVSPRRSKAWGFILAPRLWTLLEGIGFLPREQLTWVKADLPDEAIVCNNSTAWGTWRSASNPVLRAIAEPVFIASKETHTRAPGESDLSRDEFLAWTRNTWFISTGFREQSLAHPAIFPLELPRRLIKLYSYVGDTVLDPFCGSGTTLRAAKDAGRRGIGVELSPKYVRMAANRCRQDLLFVAAADG